MGGLAGALGRAIGAIRWLCPARAPGCPHQTPWAKALSEMSSQQLAGLGEPPRGRL